MYIEEIDYQGYLSLKQLYNQAVVENKEQIVFGKHLLLTSYTKYLIEHLSKKFENQKK